MSKRLQASALFYAITVVLIVGMMMSSLVLLTHFRNLSAIRWVNKQRINENCRSAAYLALGHAQDRHGVVRTDLYGDGSDSVETQVIPWGVFDLVHARAWIGDQETNALGLAGALFEMRRVLDLHRSSGPLHVCGDARIRGNVRIPQADVRRGHIEGKPFTGDQPVEGDVMRAANEQLRLRTDLEQEVEEGCRGAYLGELLPIESGPDRTIRSSHEGLQDGVLSMRFSGPTHLSGYRIHGPMVIQCNDTLFIDATNELHLVIIQAPFIRVGSGARFSAQCFASAGIHLEAEAELRFPSVLAIWHDSRSSTAARIRLDSGSVVEGAVIAVDRSVRNRDQASILIEPGATVLGEVFAEGAVQHSGTVKGVIHANELILRTASSMYRGYLMDGVIERFDLGKPWGVSCTGNGIERTILEWEPSKAQREES
ncbi:MAG: hypothetical protein KDC00_11070 [Flavobacteriales bacterium]|nr:hypothetical protein [Flavobacteriales bacterium]